VTLVEDTSTNLTLLGGGGGGGALSYAILSNPTNGLLGALNPSTGVVSYTPNLNTNGVDTFRFTVSDGSQQATGTVSLTITAVNDAPTLGLATNNVVVLEDSGVVTVTSFAATTVGPANESGQSVTNIAVLNVSNATLFAVGPAISAAGTLTFTPAGNSNGFAVVTVQAQDNGGTANGGTNGSVAQTFTITVLAVNDAPTLGLGTNNVVVLEDSGAATLTSFAVTTVGPANELGQSVTNIAVLSVSNATLFAVGPVISAGGTLTFTPAADGNGVALVTVQAQDDGGTANGGTNGSVAQTFTITVLAVNDAPVANDDDYNLGDGLVLNIPAPGVLTNDTDVDGDSLTAILVSGPLQGALNLNSDGGFNYTPTNYFNGVDSFTYAASDGQTNSSPATVNIVVSNTIQIVSIALSDSLVTVTWTSLAGKNYRLQYKENLSDASWTDISPDVSATGTNSTGTNAVDTAAQRFYRVLGLGN
jgi:hypothetical protein